MSVNLQKGQKIRLGREGSEGFRRIMVGLGWDPATKKSGVEIDCDASAILLKNGKLEDFNADVVYYNNLHHASGAVSHQGDNLKGGEETADDEEIFIDLASLGKEYDRIVFVVTIYKSVERSLHFGLITDAFIRVCDIISDIEFCRFNLTDDYAGKTAVIVGELVREPDDTWGFRTIGEGTNDDGILQVAKRFN